MKEGLCYGHTQMSTFFKVFFSRLVRLKGLGVSWVIVSSSSASCFTFMVPFFFTKLSEWIPGCLPFMKLM